MNKDDLKTNRFLLILLIVAIVAILIIAGGYFSQFGSLPNNDMSEETQGLVGTWGTVGDYFGGTLNPILAFCSLLALCYTISLQNKQLKKTDEQLEQNKLALEQNKTALEQNAKALELNNQELKNSTEQLQLSAKAQAEMEKTQKIQQFEGLFTYMLGELTEFNNIARSQSNEHGLLSSCNEPVENFAFNFYNAQYLLQSNFHLVKFFMYLYQILKLIATQDDKFFPKQRKKQYANIVRAGVDEYLLKLAFFNYLIIDEINNEDFQPFKALLEQFEFFEHLRLYIEGSAYSDESNKPFYLSGFYHPKAYGNAKNVKLSIAEIIGNERENEDYKLSPSLKLDFIILESKNKNDDLKIHTLHFKKITDIHHATMIENDILIIAKIEFIFNDIKLAFDTIKKKIIVITPDITTEFDYIP
ncbi:putative phage abortive infection protein [Moraxella bovoculi]|uniref:putative phage abortive infection protein n=1 Tax=Moraxella bovoculi TaxID=386891 RepID=UPI003F507A86